METKGRSYLLGETGRMVGFGFAPHPVMANHFIEAVFYKTQTEYVICITEGPGKGDPTSQRTGLGTKVKGKFFAQYAQRCIGGECSLEDFKKIMEESLSLGMPGIVFEWWDGK